MGEDTRGPEARLVPGAPFLGLGEYDLAVLGYERREFFISGTAVAYAGDPPPEDGAWVVRPGEAAAYVTRIVVVTPLEPARFNGTVAVEWLNVSGGRDAAVVWSMAHRAMAREGYAYVAVSAQKVGIDGGLSLHSADMPLKLADPERYAGLVHPGDAWAYDIFSQTGRVVRGGEVLGGLVPERLLAVGMSQSAMYLASYATAIDPLARVYDGFLVHSRFGYGAGLEGHSALRPAAGAVALGLKLRADLRVPVLTVVTETDVLGGPVQGFYWARQADTARHVVWEIAGSAHADNYIYRVGSMDSGLAGIEALVAAWAPMRGSAELQYPMNFGPQHHYVVQAALAGLERWVSSGVAPPAAQGLRVEGEPVPGETPELVRDAHGIAMGGVRTPWVDVPTARLAGTGNSGLPGVWLLGLGESFAPDKLARLYPGGRSDYMRRFDAALEGAIEAGFILADDRQEILKIAVEAYGSGRLAE